MKVIGMKLITDKKRAILQANEGLGGKVEGKSVEGKDLLSLLIRANMATDLPESARLNDEDVLARKLMVYFLLLIAYFVDRGSYLLGRGS